MDPSRASKFYLNGCGESVCLSGSLLVRWMRSGSVLSKRIQIDLCCKHRQGTDLSVVLVGG